MSLNIEYDNEKTNKPCDYCGNLPNELIGVYTIKQWCKHYYMNICELCIFDKKRRLHFGNLKKNKQNNMCIIL